MNELVKFLTDPFLKEDTNLEYDNSVPSSKGGEKYPIPEKNKIKVKIEDVKFESIKEFIKKNKKLLSESLVTSLVDGGTNERSPFASLDGYLHFAKMRSENSGYTYLDDIFDPKFVYGNELKGPPTPIKDSELNQILEHYKKIDNLYLEYVTKFDDTVMARDGSDYDQNSGTMEDTSDIKKQNLVPKTKGLGNDWDGKPTNTELNYKKKITRTPRGRHI